MAENSTYIEQPRLHPLLSIVRPWGHNTKEQSNVNGLESSEPFKVSGCALAVMSLSAGGVWGKWFHGPDLKPC